MMTPTRRSSYRMLPDIPAPSVIQEWRLSLVRPITRTNLITNPSVETATTNYTAVGGSIARSTTYQYHGAYSLAITPTAATTDGVYYGTVSLTSGTTYAASVKVLVPNAAGRTYRLAFATTGGVMLQTTSFVATGRWQWVTCLYTETSSTTRRIYVSKNGGTEAAVFYIDGLQVEACESGNQFATTYIDGDQVGLLGDLEPTPAYYWTGTPHASTSVRSGQTRAGGQVVNFASYGFLVTMILGLGMAPVEPVVTPFGLLDGSQYLDKRKASRSLTISGRWEGSTPRQVQRRIAALADDLERDKIATRQPLTLLAEPLNANGDPIRAPIALAGIDYVGGLEGALAGLPVAETAITFTQYLPRIVVRDEGVALDVQDSVASSSLFIRLPTGTWTTPGSLDNGAVNAIARGPDGTIYFGGAFTNAGGDANADRIVAYNPTAGTYTAMGAGLNAPVYAIAVRADGVVFAGGEFTNAGGDANADYIAQWNGAAWSAPVAAATNNFVRALAFAADGTLYAGGDFTTIGGVAINRIASYNGTAFSAMGTGANSNVDSVLVPGDGYVYIGGNFSAVGGAANTDEFARWSVSGAAWQAGTGATNGRVFALTKGLDQRIYIGGVFSTIRDVAANEVAIWNGVAPAPLGTGLGPGATQVNALAADAIGTVYAGGTFTTANGITLPDRVARWNGATWTPLDLDISGTPGISSLFIAPDGTLYLGIDALSAGTAISSGFATATNSGSAAAYPTIEITGPTSGTATIYQLANATTGEALFFNLTMTPGETATLVLDPANISFTSTFQGNILSSILPGSNVATFALQPGANTISFLAGSSTVTATMTWPVTVAGLEDAWSLR